MFWECIGPNGVGRLVLCEDSLNATKYIAILQNNLLQSVEKMFGDEGRPFIFQQDKALPPPRRAKITNNFSKEASIGVLPCPSQSPDLNIIENVWLYIQNKIYRDPVDAPKTKDALISRVLQEWSNILLNFIKEL